MKEKEIKQTIQTTRKKEEDESNNDKEKELIHLLDCKSMFIEFNLLLRD
jgi:hypothetical protein